MIKAGVIGDPISHSLSPKLHGYFLKKYQINGSYEAILVKKENLEKSIKSIIEEGFAGFNITIPHKEKIFEIVDFKSQKAILTKAVNTVFINKDGTLEGDNSDCDGFINNLKIQISDINLNKKNIFLIGAGGAARAIIYALIIEKVAKIYITNRNTERAKNLIKDFSILAQNNNCELIFLEKNQFEKELKNCDLLVNSTSLGMINQEELNLDLADLKKSAIVYDIVYKPLITKLLQDAQNRGNMIVTGLGMLIFQALIGFEKWFKIKPEVNKKEFEELSNYLIK